MASKTLTARESIEAAFAAGTERTLKAATIIERVAANPKSKIPAATISTQLHRQSKERKWIKKTKPGTFQLIEQKAAESTNGKAAAAPVAEVKPDPKPGSKAKEKVVA